jgi:hypothetical protein
MRTNSCQCSRRNHSIERATAAGVDAKLIVKPGAAHGWAGMEKDMVAIVDWFDAHLPVAVEVAHDNFFRRRAAPRMSFLHRHQICADGDGGAVLLSAAGRFACSSLRRRFSSFLAFFSRSLRRFSNW